MASPFAGMGACAAIEDAAAFTESLQKAQTVEAALKTFQAEREGDVTAIEKTAGRNEWLMSHTPDEKLMEIAGGMTSGHS